jgi:hypothetical protein
MRPAGTIENNPFPEDARWDAEPGRRIRGRDRRVPWCGPGAAARVPTATVGDAHPRAVRRGLPPTADPARESIAERKLRRRQLTGRERREISGRDLRQRAKSRHSLRFPKTAAVDPLPTLSAIMLTVSMGERNGPAVSHIGGVKGCGRVHVARRWANRAVHAHRRKETHRLVKAC